MDKFKISYKCVNTPKSDGTLLGFTSGKIYQGRAYNGLFEISSLWGNGKPTVLVNRSVFEQYFELVQEHAEEEKDKAAPIVV
jgi:hypothetical protein